MHFCFHSSVEFSCIRSLHQACQSMNCPAASTASSRWRSSTLSALAINAAKFAVSPPPLHQHLKCPTSRIPGSVAPSGFLRSHASSNGVAGSASGCWDSPQLLQSTISVPAAGSPKMLLELFLPLQAAALALRPALHFTAHASATRDVHETLLLSCGSKLINCTLRDTITQKHVSQNL